jgi:hypothetical protein
MSAIFPVGNGLRIGVTSMETTSTAADCQDQEAPDKGKLTTSPPVVRRPAAAVAASLDVRAGAERWGGGGVGRLLPMARARMKIRNRGIGFVHGFVEAGIMFRNSDSLEVFVGNFFFSHRVSLFSWLF